MIIQGARWAGIVVLAVVTVAACHSHKTPPVTAQDVEATKQEAQRAVEQARAEATKDVKSAIKTGGGNPRDVALAKATAAYDIAMIKAEGDHDVATEKCQTLQAPVIQACKDQADTAYETAKVTAKATRTARQQ
jgi:hypothetical protein